MAVKSNTREEIIRRGAELIHAQGYRATGLQQILQAANIPKGSFYFYFRSKEEFGMAVIDHFTATIGQTFLSFLGDRSLAPLARLERLFAFYETAFEQMGGARGCPIGNLSLELADANDRLREHLKTVIETLISHIEGNLEEAREAGSLPAGLDPADAARFIFHGFEGAALHMKVKKDIEPFQCFRRCLDAYLSMKES